MTNRPFSRVLRGLVALGVIAVSGNVLAQNARATDVRAARVIEHWTPERRAAAIPRDLVIDERGLGYMRAPGNVLVPYGHNIAVQAGPSGDSTGPAVSDMNPAAGQIIGASYTFTATVSDPSGVKSVSFKLQKGTGATQSFNASGAGGVYSVSLSGFTIGTWSWWVVAKDNVKGGNTTTTGKVTFEVKTGDGGGGGGGGGGGTPNAEWTGGGVVQNAAGRIYFEMPSNSRRTRWAGYVCSGTVVNDGTAADRSIILTAAHCVYDDVYKAFARNVLFIPNQDGTTGTGTDLNCGNDPIGCWTPNVGVVDNNWTTRTFPDNIPWDYAYYVVSNSGEHSGNASASSALDGSVTAMDISFSAPTVGDVTHALGYSYSEDPNFMYCADTMGTEGTANWWIATCGLSGGSSGGPWVQPMTNGNGPVISVNSWGYTNQPGMAGPKLSGTSALCVFNVATGAGISGSFADGDAGYKVGCP